MARMRERNFAREIKMYLFPLFEKEGAGGDFKSLLNPPFAKRRKK